jgi:hypothetical protein
MDNSYVILFYPVICIFSPFSTNRIPSYLDSHVDMVSNLDPVSIIFFSLFNGYLVISAKRLGVSNVHRNYDGFCIESALGPPSPPVKSDRNRVETSDILCLASRSLVGVDGYKIIMGPWAILDKFTSQGES